MDKPVGKAAVTDALIEATIELFIEKGLSMSVREIASRAGVNHGLVHTYFGSKDTLVATALDVVNQRAAAESDHRGYPPPDLAERRGGELAKAVARSLLEDERDPFPAHRISASWRAALTADRPDLSSDEIEERVIIASTLGLGWALFADQLCVTNDISPERRAEIAKTVAQTVAEIGCIPDEPTEPPDPGT